MKAVMMLTVMSAVAMMVWMPDPAHSAKSNEGLGEVVAELMREIASLKTNRAQNQGSSSFFVRWGRKSCPSSSTLVYSGIMAGKYYTKKGSGTNTLCLTKTPKYDTKHGNGYASLYGAEYFFPGHLNHDAVCSVCLAPQSTTIMVPGTYVCPSGWRRQYSGHLVASYDGNQATEFVCLDGSPEDEVGGSRRHTGHFIHYVQAGCGSLSCPPFSSRKVVTCSVCSK